MFSTLMILMFNSPNQKLENKITQDISNYGNSKVIVKKIKTSKVTVKKNEVIYDVPKNQTKLKNISFVPISNYIKKTGHQLFDKRTKITSQKSYSVENKEKFIKISNILGSYNKGFKFYGRYVYRKTHIRSTKLLKDLNIQLPSQLEVLFDNNAKPFIKKLKEKGYNKVAKGIERIIKKGHIQDLYKFLKGILNGKIPASCG